MEMYDVVKKLLGEIDPVGETQTDKIMFENLKATSDLVDKLIKDINYVAIYNKDRHEFSMKQSGEFASKFLDQLEPFAEIIYDLIERQKGLLVACENLVRGQLQHPSFEGYVRHAVSVAKDAIEKATD